MRKLSLDELERCTVEEYKTKPKLNLVIVLDNIRSAHNVGSFFRTADGLGLERIMLCGISAQPPHKEINKAAIGATNSVDWAYIKDIKTAIQQLIGDGYKILGIEQTDSSVHLKEIQLAESNKYAVVFGNEVEGLSDSILDLLDQAIEIEQYGTKHSFNVAVCGGMVLWELARQLRK